MELKGTKTEKNLMEAFAGESMARNKYTFFASVARKEGYEQLAAIFEETAGNEKEHAKLWFKALCGGALPDTMTCLEMAASGENDEWTEMYPRLPRPRCQPQGGQGLCPGRAAGVGLPELRLHPYRQVCTPQVPGLRPSPELF